MHMQNDIHLVFTSIFSKFSSEIKHSNSGMIKYVLTEIGRVIQENGWLSVTVLGPRYCWSVYKP